MAAVEELALMVVTDNWIPIEHIYDVIRIPDEGLGLDSCAVAKRVGWCAMSRGGRPWRGLLII